MDMEREKLTHYNPTLYISKDVPLPSHQPLSTHPSRFSPTLATQASSSFLGPSVTSSKSLPNHLTSETTFPPLKPFVLFGFFLINLFGFPRS